MKSIQHATVAADPVLLKVFTVNATELVAVVIVGSVVTPFSSSVPVVSSAVAATSCSVPLSASGATVPSRRLVTMMCCGPSSAAVVL